MPLSALPSPEATLTLLRAALAATQDAVLITEAEPIDLPGPRIVFVNEGFTRMTGWEPAEVIGLTPRLLQTPETDRGELDRIRAALKAWQPVRAELLNKTRDGTPIWVELEIAPLADATGYYTHWVAVQRDITARRAREREAAETAVRLQQLTDELVLANRIAHLGTWRWTVATRALEWSAEVFRMFGVTPGTFVPTLETALELVHPDDREQTVRRLDAIAAGHGPVEFDFRTLGHDGVTRHCHSEGSRVLDAAGNTISIAGFCQDVSGRREAEALLLQTEKLNSIGQLTGGLAHDFNNLLTVISLNLEIASDMLGDGHPALEMLVPAQKAANSGAQLTSSLLSFARRKPMHPRPADVNQLVSEVRSLATRTIGERHMLALELQPDLPRCMLDRAQFESAMLNLLVNSRDAMHGGGTIILRTETVELSVERAKKLTDVAPGRYVMVAVIDTGAGIPASLQVKVFEPFFTTKKVGKGTGLGLSMVMGFARQSGGQIELDSEVGRGTTVRLYFPALPAS